ncbi:mucin-5B-like [Anarrhichthys ocellatus]|uniref:mucin-5B-like n=1 Tax=Anarrhichthys ocellatus TaxID=433405 RepID=UPI0012ED9DD9|nr:mucin-5B-like [Anarrhichthys ocellatus]
MTSDRSSFLLSVDPTAVSQMVITSSDRGTSVDIFLSGDVLFEGNVYPRIGEISGAGGCSEWCYRSAAVTMCCESASCPEGESSTLLNNTWGCAKKDIDDKICENGEACGVQSQPRQAQCWILGGDHFYTFDGKVFEFLGNCTYTLIHLLKDTRENMTFWVEVQKDRTPKEASSLKAIHVNVAKDNITIHRGEHAWINGEKRLPVTLQFGLVKIYQSGSLPCHL